VKCWDFTVGKDESRTHSEGGTVAVVALSEVDSAVAGAPVALRFRLQDAAKKPVSGAADVRVFAYRAPGLSKQWIPAKALPDGVYEVRFQLPQPGSYYLHVDAPSIGLALHQNRLALINVP